MATYLETILKVVRKEVEEAKVRRSLRALEKWLPNIPPPLDFNAALEGGCLIAEIKKCSPSIGSMRAKNVTDAPSAYESSHLVHAVSILTNKTFFGMGIDDFDNLRKIITKPILSKDFIIEEYQIVEARAYGADAILLMGNVLDGEAFKRLHAFARSLGLHVLCEVHTESHIKALPHGVEICGINSRKFADGNRFLFNQVIASGLLKQDASTDKSVFKLIDKLPVAAKKVAESGVSLRTYSDVVSMGFDAALIGASLLTSERGIRTELELFEHASVNHFKRNAVPA